MDIEKRNAQLNVLRERVEVFAARVAPLYSILNWKWSGEGQLPDTVPDRKRIEREAIRLIGGAIKSRADTHAFGCGGICVTIDESEETGAIDVGLEFVLAEMVYSD